MVEEIAHIIPTHERPGVCQRLVDSINRQWEGSNIYVCDDGENPGKYEGAENIPAPAYDIGLSAKRNLLVQETEEPYIFVWDDDYVAYEETSLEMFYYTLKALDGVGIVAGEWMLENEIRDRWFCGRIIPEGGVVRLRPSQNQPATVETEIGEVRYHTLPLTANWFLAKRETLETCPWDEILKLNEHLEFFARLSALRNETENDKKWRQRYEKLARGEPLKESETGKIPVYTLTTFYDPHALPGDQKEISQGNWVEMEEDIAEELAEKGYVTYLDDVSDDKPFYLPELSGDEELGVVMIPDTTCMHIRFSSRDENYNENRFRWSDFQPIQKSKLGVKKRDLSQWSHYPYGEPDFKSPPEHILERPQTDSW